MINRTILAIAFLLFGPYTGTLGALPQAPGTVAEEIHVGQGGEGGFSGPIFADDRFGVHLASLGDLDEDGVPDMAATSYNHAATPVDAGAVWILFMNRDGTVKSELKLDSLDPLLLPHLGAGDYFGSGLAGIGDLDRDGNPDLVAGAVRDDDGGTDTGALYVLFLRSNGTLKSVRKIGSADIAGLDPGDGFGSDITCQGDVDGDGIQDLAVGAWMDDDGNPNAGAAWILFMNRDGTVRATQKISEVSGGLGDVLSGQDLFGERLSSIGDLDCDGIEELAVGVLRDDNSGPNRGAVWVLFLNVDGTVRSKQKISDIDGGSGISLQDFDQFGSPVGLGDVDRDGVPDMAVGVRHGDYQVIDSGKVFVMLLNPDATVKSHVLITDFSGGFGGSLGDTDEFGNEMALLGDLDGDGNPDLAVGTPGRDKHVANGGGFWILFLNSFGCGESRDLPFLYSITHPEFTAITDVALAAPCRKNIGRKKTAIMLIADSAPSSTTIHNQVHVFQGTAIGPVYIGSYPETLVGGHSLQAIAVNDIPWHPDPGVSGLHPNFGKVYVGGKFGVAAFDIEYDSGGSFLSLKNETILPASASWNWGFVSGLAVGPNGDLYLVVNSGANPGAHRIPWDELDDPFPPNMETFPVSAPNDVSVSNSGIACFTARQPLSFKPMLHRFYPGSTPLDSTTLDHCDAFLTWGIDAHALHEEPWIALEDQEFPQACGGHAIFSRSALDVRDFIGSATPEPLPSPQGLEYKRFWERRPNGAEHVVICRERLAAVVWEDTGFRIDVFGKDHESTRQPSAAWWRFEHFQASTDSKVIDHLAQSPGFLKGSPPPRPVPGPVACAMSFDGQAAYVEVPDTPRINVGDGDFSIEAWVKTEQSNGIRAILDKRVAGRGYHLYTSNGRLGLQMATGSFSNYEDREDPNLFLADGCWHHVVVSVQRPQSLVSNNPGSVTFFIDGSIRRIWRRSRPGNLDAQTSLWIGKHKTNSNGSFEGSLDELTLYKRALDCMDVSELYAAGCAGKTLPIILSSGSDHTAH